MGAGEFYIITGGETSGDYYTPLWISIGLIILTIGIIIFAALKAKDNENNSRRKKEKKF